MSYANFIPTIWAAKIEEARKPVYVGVNLCNRDWEGDIKQAGDKVKINGVTRPTISVYSAATGLSDPETLPDQSTMFSVDKSISFNFMVGDIDARQAKGDLMNAELTESALGMAEYQDSYIYELIQAAKTYDDTVTGLLSTTVLSHILKGMKTLYAAGVPTTERISIEASPSFVEKMQLAKILNDTNNSTTITNGFVDAMRIFGADLYMTNNLYVDASGYEYIVLRTKKAVTYANQISSVEAYRPEKYFADAVRGLEVFGAKVIRPKEVYVLRVVSYGTETGI